jgi:type III secretory pathway component EscS
MEPASNQLIANLSKRFQPIWVLVIPALLMCIALFSPWMSYQLVHYENGTLLPPLAYSLWNLDFFVWTIIVLIILLCSIRDVFGRYHLITILTSLLGYHSIVTLYGHYSRYLLISDFQNVQLHFGYYLLIIACCLMMAGLVWIALQARAKEKREIELRYGLAKPKSL